MFCTAPIQIIKKDTVWTINPGTGLAETQVVQCGQCPTCLAGRKNDWTGRLIAEALNAQSVYFLTLTYAEEPQDFCYADIQRMLWHLRTDLRREEGKSVRFFCVGERGNKKGRIHWHMLLFFDAPHHLRRMKPGEKWKYWQHGWTSIDAVPKHDIAQRVRYCAKYAVKSIGDERACRARFSLKPAIGSVYALKFARDVAESGLPFLGWYRIPNITWSRGNRKGQLIKFRLRGSTARQACKAYHYQWMEHRAGRPWPESNFMHNYGHWTEKAPVWDEEKGRFEMDTYEVDAMQLRRQIWPETATMEPIRAHPTGRNNWVTTYECDDKGKMSVCVHKPLGGGHTLLAPVWMQKGARDQMERELNGGSEKETLEKKIERRERALEWERENKGTLAKHSRQVECDKHFGPLVHHPAVREYIETGKIPYNGYVEICPDIIDTLDYVVHGLASVPSVVRSEYAAWAAARFEKRRAIWITGQDCAEKINPETGECEIVAVPRGQGDGAEALGFFPQAGGIAERAANKTRGPLNAPQHPRPKGTAR